MDLWVSEAGVLRQGEQSYRCALGKAGLRFEKREGDSATPIGRFPLRRLFYRADRLAAPITRLPLRAITPQDGWCDDPAHEDYNRLISLPHPARHETLWREDGLYDLLVVLGHNDSPPIAGEGSAIFLHLARPDYSGTEGCVALALPDLLAVLADLGPEDRLIVSALQK